MIIIKTELVIFLITSSLFLSANEIKLNKVIKQQISNYKNSSIAQKKISNLSHKSTDMIDEYFIVLNQIKNTRNYNKHTKILLQNQLTEIKSIYTQIKEVKKTGKEITPLMLEMTKNLETFIHLDVPFLIKERRTRINKIKKIMNRADISVSEKYRRLVEAYQIENIYGKTIEAYEGIQDIQGKKLTVNYLRLGRISLIYQSKDGKKQAYWNQQKQIWVPLSSRYSKVIESGIKTAKKQQPPTLITVPIAAPIKVSAIKN